MMQKVKITEVCEFQGGTQPPKNQWKNEKHDGYVRMLQIRDFTQRHKDNVEYVSEKANLKTCNKDDILIGRYGASIGKICTGLSGAYNVALIKTIPNLERIDRKFLYYLLVGSTFQNFISNVGSRAAQAGFNKSDLEKFEIPLPSLKDQQKIAAILDEADRLRQLDKQLIQKYEDLSQSLFLEMFGDPFLGKTVPLKQSINIIGGYAFKSKDFCEEGIPLIKIGTVNKGFFDISDFSYLPYGIKKQYKKWLVYPGDILMTLTGTVGKEDYGNVELATNDHNYYFLNQRVAKIESKGNYKSEFLFGLLSHPKVKKQLTKISRGVRQANISNKDILDLEVIVPEIQDQNKYIQAINSINEQILSVRINQDLNEQLFQSLLQKAFKGELV